MEAAVLSAGTALNSLPGRKEKQPYLFKFQLRNKEIVPQVYIIIFQNHAEALAEILKLSPT
jgi:hypothetical protein